MFKETKKINTSIRYKETIPVMLEERYNTIHMKTQLDIKK